jgi:5-formyltetrahydrofolate cyclo-ligase
MIDIYQSFKNNKIIKIGIGFSFQKVKSLPINKYDKKLDFIITEKDFI